MLFLPTHCDEVEPLDIDAEWMSLKKIINEVPYTISLERARPPTMEQVRRLVANQRNRVVHFMGHGGQHETGAILCFEKDNGELHPVTARDSCCACVEACFWSRSMPVSAQHQDQPTSVISRRRCAEKTPYALGMRLSIRDDDARNFSRSFYGDLASGVSVEEALFQARLTLANSPRSWVIGVPVLYTALTTPAAGFTSIEGDPPSTSISPLSRPARFPVLRAHFKGASMN